MNKHYLLLFSLAMLGSLSASSVRAQGPALENGYYQVSNISELYWIAEQVNSGELSENVNVKVLYNLQDNETYTYWDQIKDIAHGNTAYTGSEGLQLWTPIGTEEHPYSGIFDGGGNTITGLFMAPDAPNYGGIFGVIYDATIENVSSYENALVGKKAAGTIVGKMTGPRLCGVMSLAPSSMPSVRATNRKRHTQAASSVRTRRAVSFPIASITTSRTTPK